jgi:hypothetical protein
MAGTVSVAVFCATATRLASIVAAVNKVFFIVLINKLFSTPALSGSDPMGMFSAPDFSGSTPNSLNRGAKVVHFYLTTNSFM